MRTLLNYISEAIKIGASASNISVYSCQPNTKKELIDIIEDRISKEGPNCDLNDIDVSKITDMSYLFYTSEFNGDISKWDTSKVRNMSVMFGWSKFDKDISKWDVSNVDDMEGMFAWSKFNQDISRWSISEDCQTDGIFNNCPIKEKFKPKTPQEK